MDTKLKQKYDAYPPKVQARMLSIRDLILELAEALNSGEVTEILKWGEPSFLVKQGSTIRMDWKTKSPDRVSLFFNCNTNLVETFREVYGLTLVFIGKRELQLPLSTPLPVQELKHCLSMALRYHKIKHLVLLGA
ncbi:MAG: DUF1801 domain-containing protein [Kangiellaceae bacterium]|nr:DUF1801 domain-containing protein [Kangiellaceae bacterium]